LWKGTSSNKQKKKGKNTHGLIPLKAPKNSPVGSRGWGKSKVLLRKGEKEKNSDKKSLSIEKKSKKDSLWDGTLTGGNSTVPTKTWAERREYKRGNQRRPWGKPKEHVRGTKIEKPLNPGRNRRGRDGRLRRKSPPTWCKKNYGPSQGKKGLGQAL